MYKSKITSKGQLTVPKEVRDMLKLSAGNEVVFKVKGDTILFEKNYEYIDCPVCRGVGELNIINQTCFFCDRSGQINAADSIWKLLANIMSKSLKYDISVSIIQNELGDGHQVNRRIVPKLTLRSRNESNQAFQQLLDVAHDYLQLKLIEDEAPRSIQNPELFMHPSESELNEILDLLKSDDSKNQVTEWFRGDRNVYPIKTKGVHEERE